MPVISALDRLQSQLLNSGLSQKNNSLYQVINELIKNLRQNADEVQDQISNILNIINNINIAINNISVKQFPALIGDDNVAGDELMLMIGSAQSAVSSFVPYYIGPNETFTVPLYKQALFSMNIDNNGTLDIEGFLIEVD